MKRSPQIKSLFGFLAAATVATWGAYATPQTGSAKFVTVKGTVTVNSAPATVGTIANPGSQISTGSQSLAKLFLGENGPDLLLDENSNLLVDDLSFDNSGAEPVISTKLSIKQGSVSGKVKKTSAQSQYVVNAPNTTAAIRGTVYTGTSSGVVYVWDGSVDVTFTDPATGRPANFNVSKGQMFDPSIPGVVEIPPGTKNPFGPENEGVENEFDLPLPTGAITIVSPISGRK